MPMTMAIREVSGSNQTTKKWRGSAAVFSEMLANLLQTFDEALVPMDDDLQLALGDGHLMSGDDESSSLAGAMEFD